MKYTRLTRITLALLQIPLLFSVFPAQIQAGQPTAETKTPPNTATYSFGDQVNGSPPHLNNSYSGVVILTPLGGAQNLDPNTINCTWAPLSGATEYTIVIATDAALIHTVAGTPVKVTETYYQPAVLAYGTTYFWSVQATKPSESIQTVATFTTIAPPPPGVLTASAGNITYSGATLNGNLTNLEANSAVAVNFEWGLTDGYGNATSAQNMTVIGPFSAELTGLSSGLTYHYRAVAAGNETHFGNDSVFTTYSVLPIVSTASASIINSTSVQFNGNLTGLGNSTVVNVSFEWGTTTGYGNTTTTQAMNAIGIFSLFLTGLTSGQAYHSDCVGTMTMKSVRHTAWDKSPTKSRSKWKSIEIGGPSTSR